MAKVKYTPVKYPGGKYPPKSKTEVAMERSAAESRRLKAHMAHLFKKLPRISVAAGTMPKATAKTKTKASLKRSLNKKRKTQRRPKAMLDKKKEMKRRLLAMVKRKRMKNKLQDSLPLLETVAKKKKGYKIILQDPTNDVITIFCNCAKNLLKGNAQLTKAQMKKLSRDKNNIRALAAPRTSKSKKKKILQRGGFLPLLAAGALGALAPTLLGNLFGGR